MFDHAYQTRHIKAVERKSFAQQLMRDELIVFAEIRGFIRLQERECIRSRSGLGDDLILQLLCIHFTGDHHVIRFHGHDRAQAKRFLQVVLEQALQGTELAAACPRKDEHGISPAGRTECVSNPLSLASLRARSSLAAALGAR